MKVLQFNLDEDVRIKVNAYCARNYLHIKLSKDERLNKLLSLGVEVLIEMEALEQIKQEVKKTTI